MMKEMMKGLEEHLKKASDKELLRGYGKAKADFEKTGIYQVEMAMNIIKKEIDRRGLEVEDETN